MISHHHIDWWCTSQLSEQIFHCNIWTESRTEVSRRAILKELDCSLLQFLAWCPTKASKGYKAVCTSHHCSFPDTQFQCGSMAHGPAEIAFVDCNIKLVIYHGPFVQAVHFKTLYFAHHLGNNIPTCELFFLVLRIAWFPCFKLYMRALFYCTQRCYVSVRRKWNK